MDAANKKKKQFLTHYKRTKLTMNPANPAYMTAVLGSVNSGWFTWYATYPANAQ